MSTQSYNMKDMTKMKNGETTPETSCLSSRIKCVIVGFIIVVLICAVVVLAIALVNKTRTYDELVDWYEDEQTTAAVNQTKLSDVCLTFACLETANRVNQYMDTSASPCDNFYQYACGGWEKMNSIPYYSAYGWSVIEELDDYNLQFFRDALEMPISTSSFEPDVKARTMYATCMNTDSIENLGLSEPRAIIDGLGGLSFNITEPYPEFDLTQRLIEMRELKADPLFVLSINFHRHLPNTILLDLSPTPGTLIISNKESVQIFQMLGAEILNVWNDLYKDEVPPSLEVFLNTYYIMNEIKETNDALIGGYATEWNDTLLTLEQIHQLCPEINWTKIVETTLAKAGQPLPELISVSNPTYIAALSILLRNWNTRNLDNYFKFSFVMENLGYFDYKYRKVQENLLNKLLLSREFWRPEPRWIFCVNEMKKSFELVLGRWYVEDYLEHEETVVQDVDAMIEQIRATYIKVFENTELLDTETREFAIRKIKAMDKQIAYSEENTNVTVLEKLYDHFVAADNNSFFMNKLLTVLDDPYFEFTLVGTLSDKDWSSLWLDNIFVVNGFYSSNFNRFTILAGILQGAFYELGNPQFMNYGSMGFTIGHEFTHGFDDTGRFYGLDGLLHSWWSDESEANYQVAKNCYAAQYSGLEISAYGSNDTYLTNGNYTLDENIADNGAEYVVYQAYEAWVEKHGKEKLLPTPLLDTWQKQYYIAQAQGWCAKFTSTGLSIMSGSFAHSQKEARVNGMYQNSVRFAEAFQCPSGTPMNPEKKCKLW